MENITENEDSLNTEEEETSKNDEGEKDFEQLYENQKVRAEKAEKENKTLKAEKPTPKKEEDETSKQTSNYSVKDFRALNNVEDDDVDKVTDYAEKFHNGSIHEAMKDTDLGAILRNRKEERKTAAASNTGGGKRGSSSASGKALLSKAQESNEFPDEKNIDKVLDEKYSPSA